jgi:hypothetical protein
VVVVEEEEDEEEEGGGEALHRSACLPPFRCRILGYRTQDGVLIQGKQEGGDDVAVVDGAGARGREGRRRGRERRKEEEGEKKKDLQIS